MIISVIPYPNNVRFNSGCFMFSQKTFPIKKETDISMDEEAYRLTVTPETVCITAASEKGFFYGEQTLEQMLDTARDNKIPCCEIDDAPAFKYRGFMIDCARHFFTVADLKKMIDACARLKMNVFHWHLTDDQGWRIELDCYKELTEKGASRPYSDFGRYNEPGEHTGYYTKQDIREVLAYCAERFITVIPEIEMPGHASSLLAAIPELSCFSEPVKVKTSGGVYEDTLCIGNPKTEEALQNILNEVIDLFPGEYIHLGGDEAPKFHWHACPKCQEVMKRKHLKNEGELQCWFTNRMAAYLSQKGKKAIVWNDALKGGHLHPDITVQHWLGDSDLSSRHVNAGGQLIVSEFFHYYMDYSYGQTPLNKTYSYEPLPAGIQPGRKKDILGVEAPIWTEYVSDINKMAFQCFPRMMAVAETGWTQSNKKDPSGFNERAKQFVPVLKGIGLKPADEKYWNMGLGNRVGSLLNFWYHATAWKEIEANIKRLHKERKEEKRE